MAVSSSIGQALLNVPMGDMIREMAFAIAEAQIKLDENSIEVAEMMGGLSTVVDDSTGEVTFEDSRVFFGSEQVSFSSAVATFNAADTQFKRVLYESMGTSNFDYKDAAGDSATITSNTTDTAVDEINAFLSSTGASTPEAFTSIPVRLSMLELGFTPTFYQFVDTIIEVRIAISFTREAETEITTESKNKSVTKTKALRRSRRKLGQKRKNRTVTTNQVNASYSSKYSYSAEGSSLLRTKLAPVPPPEVLEERIRLQLENAKPTNPTPATN